MAGETVKIAVERLHVHGHMRHALRAVYQHNGPRVMSVLDDFLDGINRAERV